MSSFIKFLNLVVNHWDQYLMYWGVKIINTFLSWVFGLIDGMLDPLVNTLPTLDFPLQSIIYAFSWANRFIAIDYAVLLFAVWLVIRFGVTVINWILGLIPTVS